jgi:hypothetical protein
MIKRFPVIRTSIADSGDYDYLIENGIHNTLGPLWAWADEQGIKLSFEKNIENNPATYSLELLVNAMFEDPAHLALFKLSFSELPYRQFSMNDMQPIFY